jgi:hypothetical protein
MIDLYSLLFALYTTIDKTLFDYILTFGTEEKHNTHLYILLVQSRSFLEASSPVLYCRWNKSFVLDLFIKLL